MPHCSAQAERRYVLATGMPMKSVPTFLCVGMPKCGTSTVHDVLAAQDDIFLPPVKEINFFAYSHLDYQKSLAELFLSKHWAARQDRLAILRGVKRVFLRQRRWADLAWLMRYTFGRNDTLWYSSLFPQDRISGDISPSYCLLEPSEIEWLANLHPGLKILIVLRSPLQQIWSHCRMSVVRIGKKADLAAFNANIEELTGYRPTYRGLVDDWSAVFGDRVFVGYLEDMAADPIDFFSSLMDFLGARFTCKSLAAKGKSHVGVPYPVPEGVRAALAKHAALRLEGFESVSPRRAAEWRAELDAFRQAEGVA